MELTEKDKQTLSRYGYTGGDMPQIQSAAARCRYEDRDGNRLTAEETIKRIGREMWLSGLGRAAFHWTCERDGVHFDCSVIFK